MMKKGIHTMLTRNLESDGEELSGGEVQKLMLARALYRDGATLVLDEPTAALDPLAESRMYETYTAFGKDKTSVFISHRLSSTRFCDRICFLQNGEIVEEGTHEALMHQNGSYANMFAVQAKYYKEQGEKKDETEM
ncbi:MAG: ATP-binding cassette domain-containing protein [Agathobacter sp.]|nr:ATP-binding cassette domain-containing protein [Agathobacter sp.]